MAHDLNDPTRLLDSLRDDNARLTLALSQAKADLAKATKDAALWEGIAHQGVICADVAVLSEDGLDGSEADKLRAVWEAATAGNHQPYLDELKREATQFLTSAIAERDEWKARADRAEAALELEVNTGFRNLHLANEAFKSYKTKSEALAREQERVITQAVSLLDGMILSGRVDQHECRNTLQKLRKALTPEPAKGADTATHCSHGVERGKPCRDFLGEKPAKEDGNNG